MIADRDLRMEQGNTGEMAVLRRLMCSGRHYTLCGQEHWLPGYSHNKFRIIHGNQTIDAIRHFPDFCVGDTFIQAKCATNWEKKYQSVTIEAASYNVAMEIDKAGIPVLITWYFPRESPGDDNIMAQYAGKLSPREPNTERRELKGSMTPMLLVPVSQLLSFRDYGY